MITEMDPDEARRFAKWLEEETGRVMIDMRETTQAMTDLQIAWNDFKYNEYMRTFETSTESINRFRQEAERYVSYLRKKADLVAQYLG